MLGIATRLKLTEEQETLLTELVTHCQKAVLSGYQAVAKDPEVDLYALLRKQGLTSRQIGSAISQIKQLRALDKANLVERIKWLSESQRSLEAELKILQTKSKTTQGKLVKLTTNPNNQP